MKSSRKDSKRKTAKELKIMKAVVFHQHGGMEVLRYEEFPDPAPGEGEVLVRVRAASINHLDLWTRMGIPGPAIPLPHISGCDGSGEIAELGKNVNGLTVGQKILIAPGINCGTCRYCRMGWDSLCPAYQIVGYQIQGTFAEYVRIPKENALPMPDGFSFEQAASIPLVFLTAYHMLFTRAQLKLGEDVLVMAAGSGVGSSAIQLAAAAGARVIAAAGSEPKLQLAQKLGAHDVVNYQSQDLSRRVKELTGGKGADVIIEHTGGENFKHCLNALSKNGRLVTCGSTSEPVIDLNLRLLFVKHVNIMGSYMGARWELLEVLKLFQRGRLRPVLDQSFSLKDTAKAQAYIEERRNIGKVVVVP